VTGDTQQANRLIQLPPDLARIFVAEKKLAEAEPLYRRMLQILEKNFGFKDVKLCPAPDALADYAARTRSPAWRWESRAKVIESAPPAK
jgi:hypothetical protein